MTTTPEPPLAVDGREHRLHPWSWLFVLLQQLRQFVVPLLVLLFLGRGERYELVPLAGIPVLALLSVWQYFTYRYVVQADSLLVRSGLFERSLRHIPFARIHNVAVHQSLLHRLFGVAEVRLESAGGEKPEAQMRVLRLREALALERLIRHRSQAPSAAPGGDAMAAQAGRADGAGDPDEGETLLALGTAEVLRLGLVSNRGMVVVAGAFALAWQVVPERAMRAAMHDTGAAVFGYARALVPGLVAQAAVLVAAGLVAVLLLRLLSVLLALVQYHGFTLRQQGRRLTVERGLLTRLRTSASRRRIQSWTLHEGLLHRLLRRRALAVETAVAERGDDPRALREVAPIATVGNCDDLLRRLLPGVAWPPPHWRPLDRRAWLRLAWPGVLLALLVSVPAAWVWGAPGLLAWLWMPWAVLAARQHAARAGYSLDARLFAVRAGWWTRHWRVVELDKVQSLQLRRSPADRWFGTASLWLDTAGAGALAPPLRVHLLPRDEARRLYAAIATDVAARPLRW
ncbi:MAG TPA: PH domain-containing protein [Luteimonas sp.]|nr:PH domain-containing protein [Luteimonas sp.]